MRPKKGETKELFLNRATSEGVSVEIADQIWNNSCPEKVCSGNSVFEVIVHAQAGYTVTTNVFEGNTFFVVPCVLIKEGVHNGSAGPVFYPSDEIEKFPTAWNGRPAPLNHPSINGVPVSCNSPAILEGNNLGFVFNANAVAGMLKAELWLNQSRMSLKAPHILEKINKKEPVEVSTGLYFELDESPGVWNGESYDGIARNFRPDHLAILDNSPGACSVSDGCGIRANEGSGLHLVSPDEKELVFLTPGKGKSFQIVRNDYDGEMSFQTVQRMIWKVLESMDSKGVWHYLEEAGPSYFIYERNADGESVVYFKVNYKLNEEKTEVIVEGTPVEVSLIREYKEKNNGGILMNREQLIEKLKGFGFAVNEGSTMSDSELSSILEGFEKKEKEIADLQASTKKEETKTEEKVAPTDNKEMSVEDWMSKAPAPIRDMVSNSLRRENEYRGNLIKGLVANETIKKLYTEDELKAKPTEELDKLWALSASGVGKKEESSAVNTDFSFMNLSAPSPSTESKVEPLAILSLFEPK